MRFRYLILYFLCFTVFTVYPILGSAQYYNLGQDPASIKWRQIVTPHFHIIFPEDFEPRAQRMTSTLKDIYFKGSKTLSYKPKPVPLILHNLNIVPNAITAWAPKRIEIYTTPPQDAYAQDWLDQLMIHEYRHVVQIDRTNQGFTKVLSWLTGEQAAPLISGIFVPTWFLEGDAVCTETVLSQSGRGRIPGFEMPLRTQIIEKGAFNYDKAAFGSYKSFVPNKYELGYSLVANVRRRYGYNAWVSALDHVAMKPFVLTPFNKGLKKITGYGKEQLYRITMHDLDSMWRNQDLLTDKTNKVQFSVSHDKKYKNYKYPYYLNDSMIISEYSSLDDITHFLIIGTDGLQKATITPGYLSSEVYSVVNYTIVDTQSCELEKHTPENHFLVAWTELVSDHRWSQRNYSVIRIFDSYTGKIRELTRKSRYFAPAFSPDGRLLAAVRTDPSGRNSIILLDVSSGIETDTLIFSDTSFFMTPSWSGDGQQIVFTQLDGNGKSINVFDLNNRQLNSVIPATYIEISNPVFAFGYILYTGSYSGIENIYAAKLENKEIFQVTSAEFGAGFARPRADGRKIVYSDYSSVGYDLVEIDFSPASWKRLDEIINFSPSLYKHLVAEEMSVADTTFTEAITYKSDPYRKWEHIFNFHSWAPLYINYMESSNSAGVSFMSQNDLSTATTVVGYKYDMSENTGKVTLDFSLKAWYPVIDLNTSYGARTAYTGGDSSVRYNFNETILGGGFTIPLVFMGGKYYRGLNIKLYSSLNNITGNTSPLEDKLAGTINSIDYSFTAFRYHKQSYRDLYPPWGQVVSFTYRHSPFGANNLGCIIYTGTRFYFPGLMKHHGIRFDASWQKRDQGQYQYSNLIILPRGYDYENAPTIVCFALNYKFPFAYPDFSVGPLVYLKRFNANLFYDGGFASNEGEPDMLQSFGVEVVSNMHFLRLIFPLDIGFRIGYRPDEGQYFTNFLFSVNLSD